MTVNQYEGATYVTNVTETTAAAGGLQQSIHRYCGTPITTEKKVQRCYERFEVLTHGQDSLLEEGCIITHICLQYENPPEFIIFPELIPRLSMLPLLSIAGVPVTCCHSVRTCKDRFATYL